MHTVTVKNVVLGDKIPKICVPIVAKTKLEIIQEAKRLKEIPVDVVEWRADWFEKIEDFKQVQEVLKELVAVLESKPLLFTFRTANEGGEREINKEDYKRLNQSVIKTGLVDLIDAEAFIGEEILKEIIQTAHENEVKVIASNHDFNKTPPKEEIITRLKYMQEMGADICKIAVMPKDNLDVLSLLEATAIMTKQYANRPIITMSMSGMGVISRLAGEVFGSALTFAAASKASAPGQIGVNELNETLQLLHRSL